MINYLKKCDAKTLRILRAVGREADRRHMNAYVVGGTVRDIFLHKNMTDLDVAVVGNAIAVTKGLRRYSKEGAVIHRRFQTASLIWKGGIRLDLAMARKEYYRQPGALPVVAGGTLRDDLFRRDFTVNAMAICINKRNFGELIDYFGGKSDLRKKTIRILHEQSFVDDPTRILRAIRFEKRLNFAMDRKTVSLLKESLQRGDVSRVKPPRYFAEFKKMLCEDNPMSPIQRLSALKGFGFLSKSIKIPFKKLQQLHASLKKQKGDRQGKWFLYFLALINPLTHSQVKRMIGAFHFTRNERKSILQSGAIEGVISAISSKHAKPSDIYKTLRPLTDEVTEYLLLTAKDRAVKMRIKRYLKVDRKIKLKINGEDLKKFGIHSGQSMGRILSEVLYEKIDRRVFSKKDELKKALESLGKP